MRRRTPIIRASVTSQRAEDITKAIGRGYFEMAELDHN
jgi:hypothetical protein